MEVCGEVYHCVFFSVVNNSLWRHNHNTLTQQNVHFHYLLNHKTINYAEHIFLLMFKLKYYSASAVAQLISQTEMPNVPNTENIFKCIMKHDKNK